MNISSNPWTFNSSDVPAAITPTAGGLVQQGSNYGAVLLTSTAVHGLAVGVFVTIVNTSAGRFLGWYKVVAVPSTTTALLANLSSPTSGSPFNTVLAPDGGGSVLVNQIQQNPRFEDVSWQNYTASSTLSLLDRNGQVIWVASSTAAASNAQSRGKLFWVDGLTLQTLSSGTLVLTVN